MRTPGTPETGTQTQVPSSQDCSRDTHRAPYMQSTPVSYQLQARASRGRDGKKSKENTHPV